MKKGQITPKMFARFGRIDHFIVSKGRRPILREIGTMFRVTGNGTAQEIWHKYTQYKRRMGRMLNV